MLIDGMNCPLCGKESFDICKQCEVEAKCYKCGVANVINEHGRSSLFCHNHRWRCWGCFRGTNVIQASTKNL